MFWMSITSILGAAIAQNLETWLFVGFMFWLIFIKIIPTIWSFFDPD